MTIPALLAELRTRDIHVWADGDRLQCNAPAGVLTPELRDQLQQRKNEILEFLLGPAELSFAQQRLWFLDQIAPGGAAHIIAEAFELRGALDVPVLARALGALVNRHDSLRTVFESVEGEPLQVVAEPGPWSLPVEDLSGESHPRERLKVLLREEASRGFNLARGPLFRAQLYRLSPDTHVLLLAMHHIISDGWSLGVLLRELGELYRSFALGEAPTLPALRVQYRDFARWQRGWLQGEVLESQLAHWRERLSGAPQVLELPTDRPRPPVETHRGAFYSFTLPRELVERLHGLARREGATLFMTLLSGFSLLLSRYSGQQDLLIGTPVANRNRAEIEALMGVFVNALVLRADTSGEPSVREFIGRMREVCLDAYAHQDLPFERLVEELRPVRDMSRNPVFQVMFALQNAPQHALELPGLALSPIVLEHEAVQFDLSLLTRETPEGLTGVFSYAIDLFDESTIARMAAHWRSLLEAMVAAPERRIDELALLTEAERRELLEDSNRTAVAYPSARCVHELVEEQARVRPDALAAGCGGRSVTYRELDERAERLANRLRKLGVGANGLVAVYLERSIEMLVGLLGVWKAGGAYVPIDPEYPAERVRFMLEDTQALAVLTQRSLAGALPATGAAVLHLDAEEAPAARPRRRAKRAAMSAQQLAYVIYTSGSTGRPKGVPITHGSLFNLICWHQQAYEVTPVDRATQIAGPAFDASVWEIWPYLTAGASVHIPDDATRLEPGRLVRWLVEQRIRLTFLPTPLAEAALRESWPKDGALRVLLTGGDRLNQRPAHKLPFRLINHYGPTENTVVSTCAEVQEGVSKAAPPIGRPLPNTRAYVLDAHLQPVPVGVPGELLVGGVQLASGYLNRPELSAEKFVPDPFDATPGARLYKTGDLVRYLPDGNIEFLGRIDNQVKIRGYRIELGEIEAVLGRHPAIREVVVIAREDTPGDKRVVAYVVPREAQAGALGDLRSLLKQRLPDYMVPAHFVLLDTLPLTPNGKVDRKALPVPEYSGSEAGYVAPRTATEEILAGIWAEVLGLERVGVHENFFELGGHSLLATQVVSRVRQALQVELPLRDLFAAPTIAGLSVHVEALRAEPRAGLAALALEARAQPGPAPLSFAQQRLWFLHQLVPDNPFYNMRVPWRLTGELNVGALQASLDALVARHETLRTTFRTEGEAALQVIAPPGPVELAVVDLTAVPESEREAEARRRAEAEGLRPFDLSVGPLFRAQLLRLSAEDHVLLLTMHHIISDGWSIPVLYRDLGAFYQASCAGSAPSLPELSIQYADFSVWQRQWLSGSVLSEQLDYWQQRLEGISELQLPTDRSRPALPTYRGGRETLRLSPQLSAGLRALGQRNGVTLYMVLLAAFNVLLQRYTRQDDIVIGSPIANRTRAELEELIGFFVNSLVMRTDASGDPSFIELLARVRRVALDAYAHQDLPFERLVEELDPERDMNRNPLFQVMFAVQNAPGKASPLTGTSLTIGNFPIKVDTTRFDLEVHVWEAAEQLRVDFLYATDLFDAPTMRRMLGHYERLLEGVIKNPECRLSELPLLTQAERRQVLVEWNDTKTDYPANALIHELFEAQAARTPDAVALEYEGRELSYRELDARANQLARYLTRHGVGPETMVGICVERSLEMVVGVLGILKAGGAYVPLDPEYPASRLAFMLEDTQAPVLLTQASLRERLPEYAGRVVCLDTQWQEIAQEKQSALKAKVSARNLAYVIYTSGSTGRPKGTSIEHRSVVRLVKNTNYVELGPQEVFLQFAPISFDASTLELWGSLLNGAKLVVCPAGRLSLEELGRVIEERGVTTLWLTAALFHQMVDTQIESLRGVRQLLAGGETLSVPHVRRMLEVIGGNRLINGYGPTENTTFTCCHVMTANTRIEHTVPIGRPIANTRVYVLDAHRQPVPVGVYGELYIGGDGLAREYLHQPELTAEKFIPDPFDTTPGARLYKTGDLVRYLSDGNIEFLGRIDNQVKLRGYRIELGEIEATLAGHAAVRQAVAMVREDEPGDKRLVAYVVANEGALMEAVHGEESTEWSAEHVSEWRELYEQTYVEPANEEAAFNITGWNSSYTGAPIPAEEMREWVDATVERIAARRPRRVLEIGCGTGLLLARLAPACEAYLGVDFSAKALDHVRKLIGARKDLAHVTLSQRTADDFSGIERESFDTVIINSVTQYLPGIEYLKDVLDGAVAALSPGGRIFIGDVRNLPLLKAFHASVQCHRAEGRTKKAQLAQLIQSDIELEGELVIDPEFFVALKEGHDRISDVEILLKRGRHQNELTRFRYDAFVHVAAKDGASPPPAWLDWQKERLSLADVTAHLASHPAALGVRGVPNARLAQAVGALAWLASEEGPQTLEGFREAMASATNGALEPEALWALAEQHGYALELGYSKAGADACMDAVFRSRDAVIAGGVYWGRQASAPAKPWGAYANNPLKAKLVRDLTPRLHKHLAEVLPEYMVPSAFVVLDELPLTPNGKVDRKALPAPGRTRLAVAGEYVAPSTPVEEILAEIFASLLRVDRVGIHDNFFELGGHSLMATSVISRIRDRFNIDVSLTLMFNQPTVAGLGSEIDRLFSEQIDKMSEDEAQELVAQLN